MPKKCKSNHEDNNGTGLPFFAIGNDQLNEAAYIDEREMYACPHCGKKHTIKSSRGKMLDGSPGKTTLQFYKCGKKTFLAGVDGKSLLY